MRFSHVFFLAVLLGGCSSNGTYTKYSLEEKFENPHGKNLYQGLDNIIKESRYDEQASNVKLVEVSTAVSQSLNELARIQRSVHSVKHFKDDSKIIQHRVVGKTSVDWTGPVETLLKRIAKSSSLRFRTIGTPPAIPIIVSVNQKDIRVSDLIRDVAYQVQNQASISLSKDKVIEVRYLP
tara:strand:+ start:772 stop:1311 length:540 start_codon:yes stop_codon:yes gene_type:complete